MHIIYSYIVIDRNCEYGYFKLHCFSTFAKDNNPAIFCPTFIKIFFKLIKAVIYTFLSPHDT